MTPTLAGTFVGSMFAFALLVNRMLLIAEFDDVEPWEMP